MSINKLQPSIYKEYCVPEDQPVADRVVQFIENADVGFEEIIHIKSDGIVRSLKIKASPVEHHPSASRQIVGVDLDITLTEQKENQFRKLNKELAAKNRDIQYLHADLRTFAEITATDYQSGFRTIYTAFESLIEHEAGKLSNNGRGTLRKIQASLQRMNLLTDDIQRYLLITKDNSHVTVVSLDQIVGHVIADLKR